MTFLKVSLARTGDTIAARCVPAETALKRLVGLLNHDSLGDGEAMLIKPCNQVHTLFMRFSIDAVFLNQDDVVVGTRALKPWRLSPMFFRARKVLEVPAGTCEKFALKPGDKLEIQRCSS